jgi:hypothetical protein
LFFRPELLTRQDSAKSKRRTGDAAREFGKVGCLFMGIMITLWKEIDMGYNPTMAVEKAAHRAR